MACYYIVISSTHLRDGQLRSIKGVFRGPIGASGQRSTEEADSSLYCELCDKQYERQQQYDNHTSSYDHHHRQRLKELKQREFYRALASRRHRRRRVEWPQSQQHEKGPRHSAPGSGPMFRCTTVALDTEERSGDKHLKAHASCTKEPGTPLMQQVNSLDPLLEVKVGSGPHWLSSSPADSHLLPKTILEHDMDTTAPALDMSHTHLSHIDQTTQLSHVYNNTPAAHHYLRHNIPTAASDNSALCPKSTVTTTNTQSANTSSNPHVALSDNRIRPVCFSLPKRSCVLRHQSAAVFLQASTSKEGAAQTSDNVDHMELDSSEDLKDLPVPASSTYEAVKSPQTQDKAFSDRPKKSTFLPRPKEPFCQVLSRDGVTVLLWPSEMVNYTSTAPSISFSVNPLLHDFRAKSRAEDGAVRRAELERRKPSVIKQAEQQQEQRQGGAEGGGAPSKHERDRGDGGGQPGWPVEVVAHCNSSNCDESALNCPPDSEHECHLVLLKKKKGRRRKRRGRVRRGTRRRGRKRQREDKRQRARQITVNPKEEGRGNCNNGAVYRPENRTKIRGDQTGSNDEKRAELLSNLPVSWSNRCNQLCAQVNSRARRHPSQQSASEWGQSFRNLPSGEAACNAVISFVPGSDIETPRCPAITPAPSQSCTDMSEAHAENRAGQSGVVRENLRKAMIKATRDTKENHVVVRWSSLACVVAAEEQGLAVKRTCDEAISLDPVCCQAQTGSAGSRTADPTSHCYMQLPETQVKMRSTGADVSLHSAAITEQETTAVRGHKRNDNSPEAERPPRKKHKKAGRHLGECLQKTYISSDLSVQEACGSQEIQGLTDSEAQLVTAIVRTKTNTASHFVSNIEDTLYTSKMYSCCHSQGEDRHFSPEKQDKTTENSCTDCQTFPLGEYQNTPENGASDNCLTKQDKHNECCNNQSYNKRDHWCADVGQLQSNSEPAAHTGDWSDESRRQRRWNLTNDAQNTSHQTAVFSGYSCKTNERCNPNEVPKKAKSQVEDTRHPLSALSGPMMDSKSCRAIDQLRPSPGDIDGARCDYCSSNHVTNCNYPEKNTNGGVVVLISTHPEQTRKGGRGEEEEERRRRVRAIREEGRKCLRGKGEWACLPLPPPLILRQHLSLLPPPLHVPVPPYPRLMPSFSPHLSPVPPLLPQTFFPSTPVPFLDSPFPLPAAFHSLQGGRSLYGPPPPAILPMELMFS